MTDEPMRIVLDVGKTLSKLTLWRAGTLVARRVRPNACVTDGRLPVLDVEGIDRWVGEVLREYATLGPIAAIFPVAHGAAAAIVRGGRLVRAPLDYELPIPDAAATAYDAVRRQMDETGSPRLPQGLNLGAQLHMLAADDPALLDGASLLLWPQYWAWRLSGVMASEATSLGCHSDLWSPAAGTPSALAERMGWAAALPPLRRAADVIGTLSREWVERTGLSASVAVHCGIHDSNAALVAAQGFAEIADEDATVVSTGTWFVAMRSGVPAAALPQLDLARDCLMNVDAWGRAVPSARFMGGREVETLIGIDTRRIDIRPDQPALLAALPTVMDGCATMLLPGFAPGTGPFPQARGHWLGMPADWIVRRAAVSLYAALVLDAALDLIGTRGRILVEGRFAEAQLFVRALAALRPDCAVYACNAHNDVSFGAVRLIDHRLRPAGTLTPVRPVEGDVAAYRRAWRDRIGTQAIAA